MPSRGGQQGSFVAPYQVSLAYGGANARLARGTGADWFGPLDPLSPAAPPEVASRQWDLPSGYNINTNPRVYEPISFGALRGLADGYDLLRLIIETRKDQVVRMGWSIKPRDATPADPNLAQAQAAATAFFKRPDGVHPFHDRLRLLLEDLFVIDDWGRTPQPFLFELLALRSSFETPLRGSRMRVVSFRLP